MSSGDESSVSCSSLEKISPLNNTKNTNNKMNNDDVKTRFPALEGLRVVLSAWVVLLHAYGLIVFASDNENTEPKVLKYLLQAPWVPMVKYFMVQVDIFFLISGFLLSFFLLQQEEKEKTQNVCFSEKFSIFVSLVIKKLLRLWPGVFISIVASHILNDLGTDNLGKSLWNNGILMNSSEISSPISLVPVWSNQVELFGSMAVILVVLNMGPKLLRSEGCYFASAAALLTLLPPLYLTFAYPEFSASRVMKENLVTPAYMSQDRIAWLQTTYSMSNLDITCNVIDSKTRIGHASLFYFPWYSRIFPFFVGLFVAICIATKLIEKEVIITLCS